MKRISKICKSASVSQYLSFSQSNKASIQSTATTITIWNVDRQKRPWIIMYGHRPMYCSNEFDDCWNGFLPNRVGLPLVGLGKSNSLYRNKRPWIIMYGHRPMYCSNNDDIDCSVEYTRKGLPFLGVYSEFLSNFAIWVPNF